MSDRKVRFGIVGCGVIGPTHAEAIAGLPDARLVAVADALPHRAQALAERYGVRAYRDLADMLQSEEMDVVNVCTPSGQHGRDACEVMRSGRHVLVEKPMEISPAAMDEMLRVQQETGTKLGVIFQRRFDPASRQVHDLIARGALGRLVLGNAHIPWWRSQDYYDSAGWRGTRQLDGGGVLMNQGIHTVDLLQWLMGPVRSLYAYADTLAHDIEVEDVSVAVLRFQSGALGSITATTAAYPGLATRLEIYGDRGSAVLEDDHLAYLHVIREDEQAGAYGLGSGQGNQAGERAPSGPYSDGHARQIADMIAAIREDREPMIDGQAGRRAVDIILAIYESARSGREVALP